MGLARDLGASRERIGAGVVNLARNNSRVESLLAGYHSNGDLFPSENNMSFLRVKISCLRAKAQLVFHWCLYNETNYRSNTQTAVTNMTKQRML